MEVALNHANGVTYMQIDHDDSSHSLLVRFTIEWLHNTLQ